MAGEKVNVEFQIQTDLDQMLEYAAEKYNLEDKSKSLRCILDFVAKDADWDLIFKKKRCIRCGPQNGWNKDEQKS